MSNLCPTCIKRQVNLNGNEISGLAAKAIANLPSLTKLSMAENNLNVLAADALSNLPTLSELILEVRASRARVHSGAPNYFLRQTTTVCVRLGLSGSVCVPN